MPNNNPSSAYQGCWKKFKHFVTAARAAGSLAAGDKYLTRENVDLYFSEVIVELKVQPDTAKRHATALQWYSNNVEYPNDDPPFQVHPGSSRSVVARALDKQAAEYAQHYILQCHDAHANLPTDILSKADHKKVMTYVLSQNLRNDPAFHVSWTTCHATYLRIDSLAKMRLCDLRADHAHGPVEEGPNRTIISLIMQPFQHKDDTPGANQAQQPRGRQPTTGRTPKKYKKRVVGMWRHENIEQCGTGMIAMSLFDSIFRDDSISFLKLPNDDNNNNIPPAWQTKCLLRGWHGMRTAYDSFKRILSACGVEFNHVTHLRSAGIAWASSAGELPADVLATMSKHRGERIFEAYMTELMPQVMEVMAGFTRGKTYFVPRIEVQLPYSDEEAVKLCFPSIGRWRDEQASENGDKQQSAVNFLYHLLPFLARVLLQDGPYWIRYFPNDSHTKRLLRRMPPPYARWARQEAIQEANRLIETREIRNVDNLNDGARNAFDAMTRSQQELRTEVRQLRELVQQQNDYIRAREVEQNRQMGLLQQQLVAQQANILSMLQLQTGRGGSGGNRDVQQQRREEPRRQEELEALQQNVQRQQQEVQREERAAERRRQNAARPNVNDVLHNEPWRPDLPNRLPVSMAQLLAQWNDLELHRYLQPRSRRDWPKHAKMMFCKWLYLHEKIKARALRTTFRPQVEDQAERMVQAAQSLDALRGDRSMDAFRKYLKNNDGTTRRRAPRVPRNREPHTAYETV